MFINLFGRWKKTVGSKSGLNFAPISTGKYSAGWCTPFLKLFLNIQISIRSSSPVYQSCHLLPFLLSVLTIILWNGLYILLDSRTFVDFFFTIWDLDNAESLASEFQQETTLTYHESDTDALKPYQFLELYGQGHL